MFCATGIETDCRNPACSCAGNRFCPTKTIKSRNQHDQKHHKITIDWFLSLTTPSPSPPPHFQVRFAPVVMLGALQRLLLPGIQHLDVSGPCCSTSSGSQQQWQAAGTPQQHCQQQYATRTTTPQAEAAGNNPPVQPHPQVSQLTAQQKQELKQAVIDRWESETPFANC